jgi:two-component system, cell cycle response regulator
MPDMSIQGAPSLNRVLVVDDDLDVAQLLRLLLENRGYSAKVCYGGGSALAALASEQFDLVFSDISMPGITGLELLARIREAGHDVGVILMTAFGSEQVAVDALRQGADDYLRKPFGAGDLQAVLSRTTEHLELRRRNAILQGQLAEYAARMEQRSLTDELTGIPNRRGFDQSLARLVEAARSSRATYALLMIDVDHFKTVNDRYGHPLGDEMLRAIARTLQKRVRVTDVVARIGGEEFAVLLPRATAGDAMAVGETLRAAVKDCRVPSEAGDVHVTVSVGVADSASGDQVLEDADAALYAAKNGGRDMVVLHS